MLVVAGVNDLECLLNDHRKPHHRHITRTQWQRVANFDECVSKTNVCFDHCEGAECRRTHATSNPPLDGPLAQR